MAALTDRDLEDLLLDAALLVSKDPAFLPIFERLQAEVEARKAQADALSKAKALVAAMRRRPPPGVTSFLRLVA